MADPLPPPITPDGDPDELVLRTEAEPPPLSDIRIRGPRPRGLNKPAVMIAAGGGVAIILALAVTGMPAGNAKATHEAKPMMSAPARPEIAEGAVRSLPATYEQAARMEAERAPIQPPLLGPPLPGDVAAFAPTQPQLRGQTDDEWSSHHSTPPPPEPIDSAIAEAKAAERSQLFFALREPQAQRSPATEPQNQTPPRPATTTSAQASPSPDRVLFPGAVIPASLITAIDSQSPGPVIAQITQPVHDSATGRTLVIPQGARLIGNYQNNTRYGQNRIAILWSRIIMPDGEEIALAEAATAPSGAAGVAGEVDNHWIDVFGAAALGTLINIGAASTEDPQITYGGIGLSRDPVEEATNDGVQRSAATITNRTVDRSLAIPPTIRVEAGRRIFVLVTANVAVG